MHISNKFVDMCVTCDVKRPKEDCQANSLYREDTIFCTCSEEGLWRSDACQERFKFLLPKTSHLHYQLRTSVTCEADMLYIIDCNVCRCDTTGFINVTACTTRHCTSGHKADPCQIGDILRTDEQICACSDVNFYIDRLCVSIQDHPVQKVSEVALTKLVEVGESWRRVDDLLSNTCDTEVVYSVDCNKCVCSEAHLICTTKICTLRKKIALRREKWSHKIKDMFYTLPELHSHKDSCIPGKTYRYQCNTCYCTKDGHPSCATMMCLENYVLDETALRGALSFANESLRSLPEIRDGDTCKDGKLYRQNCNTCTCKGNSLLCTKMACHDFRIPDTLRQQRKKRKAHKRSKDDVEQQLEVSDREFYLLPELPHHAAGCTPDKKYKVDCNVCICNEHKNLICDKKMCVDQKTTRDLEVKKNSGKSCTTNFETKKCVKCKCKKGVTECEAITKCQTEEDLQVLSKGAGSIHRLTFNYVEEKCVPDVVYREKCNNCYCQPDKTLRCTNKMCLNYEQALQLEKQREYLEEHGL
ncbi:unnamed protein product [Arctia plantaginis]|uniref:Pacifastin domain-containing protein n=1 Tax=Arctia plantaginis TaxID=874455 RepID=A0A8S1ARD0_ARCPL|nr:unnamed protein product [Arctia plantaginis]